MVFEQARAQTAAGTRGWAGASLDADDRQIVERVDLFLARGVALKAWWDGARQSQGTLEKFPLVFTYNRPDESYGFFGRAPVEGREMPVLGNFQTQFFDKPKAPATSQEAAARYLDEQIREYVLRYFMRVSDFRAPQPFIEGQPPPTPFLEPFSMCKGEGIRREGFGYSQLYYKRAGSGEIGKFPEAERNAIIDLRHLGPKFEWIVVKVDIFQFDVSIKPFGDDGPVFSLPLSEESYLIMTRDFVTDKTRPKPGRLGRYGLGYAFIKNPGPSLLGWGPGEFDAAFQTIDFRVQERGAIRVDMTFVANRPTEIINLSLNPVQMAAMMADFMSQGKTAPLTAPVRAITDRMPFPTFDPVLSFFAAANLMTGGLAGRQLCISRKDFEKDLILKHFQQHYNTLVGALQTWRQIPNWLDTAALPNWVKTGESA